MKTLISSLNPDKLNSLQSYSETLAFMVSEIFDNGNNYTTFSKRFPENENGLIERLNIVIEWAQQFEIENENKEWDGEWMEEVDLFIKDKLN